MPINDARTLLAVGAAVVAAGIAAWPAHARQQQQPQTPQVSTVRLADVQMRDAAVLPDTITGKYYIVSAAPGAAVRMYVSEDLVDWEGPYIIYRTPPEMWGEEVNINAIWAPEMHEYRGKYYLFLTFSSNYRLPEQWDQWFEWRPRVRRASQVLWSDSPYGPFQPFSLEPTLPAEMMTLDGTLWVEDGVPYMVFCHEWVQIVDGAIAAIQLTDDLSATVGQPTYLFRASEAPWVQDTEVEYVTDGPWLYRSVSGKLFMVWSSYSETGYTTGLAVSESGKLMGPWVQQPEPIFRDDGGHPMLFETFDGRLMMALHAPNSGPGQRIHFFEMEDTGETLRIVREFVPE